MDTQPNGSLPPVSIVVAIYNAQRTIRDCVESLLRLEYPESAREIICVDNASTDATADILQPYAGRCRIVREVRRGPAAARNAGISCARGAVIAFTDADCVVDPGWVRHLVAPLRDPAVGVAGGRILSRRPGNQIEMFGEQIHDHARALGEFTPPYAITMNWASPRDVLQGVGGFDDRFMRCSDVDMSYRLVQAGYAFRYAPQAIVYHQNERTPWGLMREGYVHGYHAVAVRDRHADFLRAIRSANGGRLAAATTTVARQWTDSLWWTLFNFGKGLGRRQATRQARRIFP